MSNVLIGIIGVILFIGLALAGALFLGPRFQESTNNSKASAAVQAVSQVAHAVNMYQAQEGALPADVTALTGAKYLKSVPSNPTSSVDAPYLNSGYVIMPLSTNAEAVCSSVVRQTTSLTVIPDNDLSRGTSCYRTASGGFAVYSKI